MGLVACAPPPIGVGEGADDLGTSDSSATSSQVDTSAVDTSAVDTSDVDTSDSSEETFVPLTDALIDTCMCDGFAQDCPAGEKCVPTIEGGSTWNCVQCVPVLGDHGPGDACIHDDESWTDDCDGSSWCLAGLCHAFCGGTADNPSCEPHEGCVIANEGAINLCATQCDPIAQSCDEGQACYATTGGLVCFVPDPSADAEICETVNDCPAGWQCILGTFLPECAGETCCTPWCDMGAPDCSDKPGTECISFFREGLLFGFEHIGVCALPP